MDQDYRPWLRRELAKHPQKPHPCRCMDCASARGELLFLGELLVSGDTVQQVVRRAS